MSVGEIKCIFFSEFHPIAGPKVTFQVSRINYMQWKLDMLNLVIKRSAIFAIALVRRIYLIIRTLDNSN